MFYSNEINLNNLDTVSEMVEAMTQAETTQFFEVTELMAIYEDAKVPHIDMIGFKDVYSIVVDGVEVEVISSLKYTKYTNSNKFATTEGVKLPMNNLVIRRGNAKKGIKSLRLTRDLYSDLPEYKEIVAKHRAKVLLLRRENIANQLLEARKLGIIDLAKADEYRLHVEFGKLDLSEEYNFLLKNGFSGLENLGVSDTRPDGYGHTTGRATSIDFYNRKVTVIGFSSDD